MSRIDLWISKGGIARINSFSRSFHGEVEKKRKWEYGKDGNLLLLYMNYTTLYLV